MFRLLRRAHADLADQSPRGCHSTIHRGPDQGFAAAQDVSLEIDPGEFVAVVGTSGCEKSTLLGIVSGLLTPSTGRIVLVALMDFGLKRPERHSSCWKLP